MRRAICLGVMAALVCATVSVAEADQQMKLSYAGYRNAETNPVHGSVTGMYWWDNFEDDGHNNQDVWTFCIEPGDWIETSNPDWYTFDMIEIDSTDSRVVQALYGTNTANNVKGARIKEVWLENMGTMFNSIEHAKQGIYDAGDGGAAAQYIQAAIWDIILSPNDTLGASKFADDDNGLLGLSTFDNGELTPFFDGANKVYALIAQDVNQQNQAIVGFSVSTPNIPVPVPAAAWPCIGLLSGLVGWKRLSNRKYRNA